MAMYRLSAPTNEENRQIQRKGGIDYAVGFQEKAEECDLRAKLDLILSN
jgi:hypothetical protein